MSRRDRLAARKEGKLDTAAFLKVADKFIDLANRENQRVNATQLHMALLWAAARYNAFVAKNIMQVENHEEFVDTMTKEYTEMLRQHLGDDTIDPE
jgi:superoxide dismutase